MENVNANTSCRGVSSRHRKLNTKGCCFLCLTVISNDAIVTKPLVSLKILQRYFQITASKDKKKVSSVIRDETATANCHPSSSQNKETESINVELCNCCKEVVGNFEDAFLSLEKAQTEVDYWSDMIHHQVSEGLKKPEVVQNYSKLMTSDPETLIQLVAVAHLRKEIMKKSLTKQTAPEARIYLHHSKLKPKKQHSGNSGDKMDQMQADLLNNEAVSGADNRRHSTLSFDMDDDEDNGMNSPTTAPPPAIASPVQLLSPTESQAETKLVPPSKKRNSFSRSTIKKWHFNSRTGKYACDVCNKQFGAKSGAYIHYESIHLKQKHKCEICKLAVFSRQDNLRTHQKTCEATLKNRLSLNQRKETDPKFRFPCPTCGKKFDRKDNMKTHIRIVHLKERNHSCDICGKKYSTNQTMERHKEVAHLGRKFTCKICNRKFQTKHGSTAHKMQCAKNKIKAEVEAL